MAARLPDDCIPTVDVSPLLAWDGVSEPDEAQRRAAHAMRLACDAAYAREHGEEREPMGFFRVLGHGVGARELAEAVAEAGRFFALPADAKMALAPRAFNASSQHTYRGYFPASVNGKEGLDLGNPLQPPPSDAAAESDAAMAVTAGDIGQRRPLGPGAPEIPDGAAERWRMLYERVRVGDAALPGWQRWVEAHYGRLLCTARALLRGLALALGAPGNAFVEGLRADEATCTLRLNYYPFTKRCTPVYVADDGTPLGCEEHRDGSVITLLYQPEVGGLQVQSERTKEWKEIDPHRDSFIINIGGCLARWSGGRLLAANHRVRVSPRERISIPFFVEPSARTWMAPLAGDAPPLFYGDYILESNKQFKEYQR